MTVTDRNLNVGDKFVATYNGITYTLEAVDLGDGRIAFQVTSPKRRNLTGKGQVGKNLFGSLSGAAEAITYPKQRNGWEFWTRVRKSPNPNNHRRAA